MTYEDLTVKWSLQPYCCSGVGDGWAPLLDALFEKLKPTGFDFASIGQIKEKYGGLRVYGSFNDEQEALLDEAESAALKTCEVCGAKGKLRKNGWWLTLCDEHVRVPK